jgi:hypothetical protein
MNNSKNANFTEFELKFCDDEYSTFDPTTSRNNIDKIYTENQSN